MDNFTIETHDRENSDDAKFISKSLVQFNDPFRVDAWKELTITFKDSNGNIIAGLNGSTNWGWLFVRLLWVAEEMRGKELGSKLMQLAEEEAKRRGCHASWLDTFEFQAPDFYEKLGYKIFGKLNNFPRGRQRFFLSKTL